MTSEAGRNRTKRLKVWMTPEDRALIDRAVTASGTDLTDFVVTNLTAASRRVLTDRITFALGPDNLQAWGRVNRHSARELRGLRELMKRPSPFKREE